MTCSINLVTTAASLLSFVGSVSSFTPTRSAAAVARQLHKINPMATLAVHSQDDDIMPENNYDSGPLEKLCSISLRACDLMTPLITSIYDELIISSSSNGSGSDGVKKVKKDNSAFTIADGTVQRLLIKCLFSKVKFRHCVGEEEEEEGEEDDDNIDDNWWNQVQGLIIPKHIQPLVKSTRLEIQSLAKHLLTSNQNDAYYAKLTVFIDPIDGTREFTNGNGEQCSICIGFADENGKAIAGVVYRPLSTPSPTWVAGAKREGYADHYFGKEGEHSMNSALLSANGSISAFLVSLIEELKIPRIKAGGAGNKMMLLLQQSISVANKVEGSDTHGHLYIQDRGVSRWDTCAAEACLEAFGGQLLKLTEFLQEEEDGYYTYLASETNRDFIPNTANLTKYNSNLKDLTLPAQKAQDACQVKAYSNLCGLVAFGKEFNTQEGRKYLRDTIRKAATNNPPSLD